MKLKLICRVEAAEAADGDEKVMNSRRSFFARLKKRNYVEAEMINQLLISS
jgi:hypothetical protein